MFEPLSLETCKKIIAEQGLVKANYHTHTYRCQHAWGTEREYIEKAIELGITTLGFSDHVPCPFHDGYVSTIRMPWEQADEYVSTLRALGKEYEKDIQIRVGFEAEYIREFHEEQVAQWKRLGLDYVILGQHFWGPENHSPYAGSLTKREDILKAYVDSSIEALQTGHFFYMAHPDLIHFTGNDEVYAREMRRLCIAAKELDIPLEMNILGQGERRQDPDPLFFMLAAETGNRVIIGLDAHELIDFEDYISYGTALYMLKELGIEPSQEVKLHGFS